MKKILIPIIIVIIAVSVIVYRNTTKKSENNKVQSSQAQVTVQNIESTVSGSGSVMPLNSQSIKAVGADTVSQVFVSKDQEVTAGQELITFENGSAAITAPYNGIISQVNVSGGDIVNPNQALLSIFDNKNFYTTISVDETDVPNLKIGQKANIKVNAFPDTSFTGTVKDISQQGTYSNGVSTFNVIIYFDKINNIKSGMSAEASIITASKNNVLAVPIEAIRDMNGKKFVILSSDDGKRKMQQVQIGINNGKMVQIVEGLTKGQEVQLPQTESSSGNQSSGRNGSGFGMMRGGGAGSFRQGGNGGSQNGGTN
ncbi:MAG: efflux RND transporter periplasmic adaptor subunit [Clostridium sp.]|uniref:efflux RND transporter periplasmic adaptor subunit n=1 Tax=Clostridium sp. TaxID=1506 RepID=UPI0025B98988|nr:efflux RND transporter periplasmic adaptor subunit [Clostridium sp.]MCH3963884.1 efflux RND transporter periplasmic adaptor subunit [Clostridium sp.]MCI1717003.1 efflux RND transporter periplasmic adaptor subunit [Clostridium sp.]MCI1801278.1 efflux RND transporter periplasmic adaptor subunit [Clostridium sp.]MCI1815124.1 efflux RND transporter periplasmic adaptor subunit [Clostridium sp.]MCI1872092.1 efflux RND transporter periplasmic adaptor subunit [Clostridium sp.]